MDEATFGALYSLVMLALGAWCVSEGADILGHYHDASIVGGFVIAWLNTAPETIFFLVALQNDKPSFAIGAISGSVIVVSTIALGLGIFLGATSARSRSFVLDKSVKAQGQVLAMTVPLLCCVLVDGFGISFGLIGIFEYAAFVWYSLGGFRGSKVAGKEKTDLESGGGEEEEKHDVEGVVEPQAKGVMFLLLGGLIIWLYSDDFIESVVKFGQGRGINPLILAFFFAPVASEAPEILESISLSMKGRRNIAVSNLLGGTISKTTLLTGILCLYGYSKHFAWQYSYTVSLALTLVCALAAGLLTSKQAKLRPAHGLLLLALFVAAALTQYSLSSPSSASAPSHVPALADPLGRLSAHGTASGGAVDLRARDIIDEINLTPFS